MAELYRAAERGDDKKVRALLFHAETNNDLGYTQLNFRHGPADGEQYTALGIACVHGHLKTVEVFLDCEDIDVDGGTHSPLWWAATHGHLAIVKLLLDYDAGTSLDAVTSAADRGHEQIVAAFVARDPGRDFSPVVRFLRQAMRGRGPMDIWRSGGRRKSLAILNGLCSS